MNINEMSVTQLEDLQVVKENELQEQTGSLATVELKMNELCRKMDELRIEKRNLSEALIKGKSNIRRIHSELRAVKIYLFRGLK